MFKQQNCGNKEELSLKNKMSEIQTEGKKLATEKRIVKIDDIVANPYNPNKMSDYIFQKMKETIASKGLFGAIYVREMAGVYQILDGEHRWKACKELGWKEIPVEVAIGEMEESDVKFWTIYFNNTHGKDDIQKRAKLYEQMDQGQAQLLPFTEEEIKNEKELFKFDFSKYEQKQEISKDKKASIISLVVPDDIKELWDRCCNISHDDKRDLTIMIYQMMNAWLEMNDNQYAEYKYQKSQERINTVIEKGLQKNQDEEN